MKQVCQKEEYGFLPSKQIHICIMYIYVYTNTQYRYVYLYICWFFSDRAHLWTRPNNLTLLRFGDPCSLVMVQCFIWKHRSKTQWFWVKFWCKSLLKKIIKRKFISTEATIPSAIHWGTPTDGMTLLSDPVVFWKNLQVSWVHLCQRKYVVASS